MKKHLLLVLSILLSFSAFSQKANLTGVLFEMNDGSRETLPFANVAVKGTSKGTTTDFDGNFTLPLEAGTYDIEFSFIGYQPKVQQITVNAGEEKYVEVELSTDTKLLEDVVVQAKADRQSETVLLLEQKKASTITQNIGAKELSRKGVSNVASGLTKVSGVSKMGSKQLFVRGLGDRYNNVTLNGLPIASPDPEMKVIPLDIFPTKVVKNLGINKAFTVSNYADFSGGNIEIETKDYPEEPFLTVSASGTFNSQTTFQDFSQMSAVTKQLEGTVPERTLHNGQNDPSAYFASGFEFDDYSAPVNSGISLIGGKKFNIGDKDLGILVSASYGKDYKRINSLLRKPSAQRLVVDYSGVENSITEDLSGLANFFLRYNNNNSVQLNSLFIRSAENNLSSFEGYNNDRSLDLFVRNAVYRQHQLFNNQLMGKHEELFKNPALHLDWGLSFALASSSQPDQRQMVYSKFNDTQYEIDQLDPGSTRRFFSYQDEYETSGNLNFTFDMSEESRSNPLPLKIHAGVQAKYKVRKFYARQFNYEYDKSYFNDVAVDPTDPSLIFNEETLGGEQLNVFFREADPLDKKNSGLMNIMAGFVAVDYEIVPEKLSMVAGLRAEYSKQKVYYRVTGMTSQTPEAENQIGGLDLFPSLNMKYAATEKANFRLAMSRTISRPLFKEMAPFTYFPIYGGLPIRGNADLKNAYNYNVDLKYELFPNMGEVFAFSVFGKYLDTPIERVTSSSSGQMLEFQNAQRAIVAGVELELNKRLGSWIGEERLLSDLSFGLNTSLIYSEIELNKEIGLVFTNEKRAMQGASPYLVNFDLSYPVQWNDNAETMLTATYNVFGPRIFAAGSYGIDDIYEMPVNTLDVLLKTKLNDKWSVDLSVKNILNPLTNYRKLELNGESVILNSEVQGVSSGISVSYTLQ